MNNIMVCVTQQKNCDRLIKYGREVMGTAEGELFIVHIAHKDFKFLGKTKEGEALEYLYQKALEYGANLTVVRSENILETLVELTEKNQVDTIVMGASREKEKKNNVAEAVKERLKDAVDIEII